MMCVGFSHNVHKLHMYFLLQLFNLERVHYKLKGNWMSQVGASIEAICRNYKFTGGMWHSFLKLNYVQLRYNIVTVISNLVL